MRFARPLSNKRLKLAARVDCRLWNESFFSAPQLKRDPLGGPPKLVESARDADNSMTLASAVIVTLVVVPPAVLVAWYRRRLLDLKATRELEHKSAETIVERTTFEVRVTREGWIALGTVVAYWGLLSLIF